ncbi:hypothetical protein DUNSADRAFT_17929 [Dunaliella salina]|uniref:Uncharacterized protein n=1 Tax=Dunaliella salina TaxID=3046 RepID=A0ABQ7H933_DUNSA|nr:hypothetical protein DUNSADRAFT_17929 [Dunaliella salina]|eukprot:KAF5843351.1 hypothetical protein DUNSADRAFT_17929 [Dunaliella salina]
MSVGGGLRTPPSGPSSSEPNGPSEAAQAGLPSTAMSQSGGAVREVRGGAAASAAVPSRLPYLPPHHQARIALQQQQQQRQRQQQQEVLGEGAASSADAPSSSPAIAIPNTSAAAPLAPNQVSASRPTPSQPGPSLALGLPASPQQHHSLTLGAMSPLTSSPDASAASTTPFLVQGMPVVTEAEHPPPAPLATSNTGWDTRPIWDGDGDGEV